MEGWVWMRVWAGKHLFQHVTTSVLGFVELWWQVHIPSSEAGQNSVQPLTNAGFAGIDLLSAAHQANDDSPILMAV